MAQNGRIGQRYGGKALRRVKGCCSMLKQRVDTIRFMRFISCPQFAMAVIMMCSGCASTVQLPHRPALVNHAVYFKLQNPAEADELIADCDRDLRWIPGVVSYYAGKRPEPARPNADDSYDVGFYLGFNSMEEYQRYLEHPAHVAAVEKWKPRWVSIRICDVIDPIN